MIRVSFGCDDYFMMSMSVFASNLCFILAVSSFLYICLFLSSGGWVEIKLKYSHFHVSDTCVSI